MQRRQPRLPRLWLMTDERITDLTSAVMRLPRGSGIVFRHHATPDRERRAMFEGVRQLARRRRLVLLLAAPPASARAWGADGAHHRSRLQSVGLRSVAVHNRRELALSNAVAADIVFVSPVFATRSHPGAAALGVVRTGLLAREASSCVVALGGMNASNARRIKALGLHGWAAIDGLS